ncbi:MAG: sterol desaturase family protein, partial [Bacteroidia bacterium]|nr:sterol desaturase family protein [Bacteroidia bacterium]MDW8158850.1 sterol desaturase family protein [Bacteroidia bacterium]
RSLILAMVVNVVLIAIPFFLLLIAIELFLNFYKKKKAYRLNDTLTDISCGIIERITGLFTKLFSIGIFAYVSENFALQHFLPLPAVSYGPLWEWGKTGFIFYPSNTLSWIIVFLAVDFFYYWAHRFSHEINLLWAGHVVHHSSEEFNLAVALRQSSLHGLFVWVFPLPLAIFGVPWQMLFVCYGINLVYQFWIHTQFINKFPKWVEYIFNTPSHHRVHHGRNPKYIDKNYAGVFIIWDRMFGTFQAEEETPTYGLTTPVNSWNPVWVNIHFFIDIFYALKKAKNFREVWEALWGKPDNLAGIERHPKKEIMDPPYNPAVPFSINLWATFQFVLTLGAAYALVQLPNLAYVYKVLGAFFIIFSLVNVGGMLELKKWVPMAQVILSLSFLLFLLHLWQAQIWQITLVLPFVILVSLTIILAVFILRSYFSIKTVNQKVEYF